MTWFLCPATSTTSSIGPIWVYWTASTGATTSVTAPMYFGQQIYQPTPYYHNARNPHAYQRPHDPEAAQQRLFERERARQATMFEGHAEAASALADGLLMEHLTPEQRDCFQRNKWFVVEGGKSKQKYRIRAKDNLVANIDVLHGPGYGEGVSHRLCAHADPKAMPLGDHLLAQKMMIEYAEENFLKIANKHSCYN